MYTPPKLTLNLKITNFEGKMIFEKASLVFGGYIIPFKRKGLYISPQQPSPQQSANLDICCSGHHTLHRHFRANSIAGLSFCNVGGVSGNYLGDFVV